MDKGNCVMCNKEIDLFKHEDYEYGYDGEVWCISCCERESDTGETY